MHSQLAVRCPYVQDVEYSSPNLHVMLCNSLLEASSQSTDSTLCFVKAILIQIYFGFCSSKSGPHLARRDAANHEEAAEWCC